MAIFLQREKRIGEVTHVLSNRLRPKLTLQGIAEPRGIDGGTDGLHASMTEAAIYQAIARSSFISRSHKPFRTGA
jgi:hypothetical protein